MDKKHTLINIIFTVSGVLAIYSFFDFNIKLWLENTNHLNLILTAVGFLLLTNVAIISAIEVENIYLRWAYIYGIRILSIVLPAFLLINGFLFIANGVMESVVAINIQSPLIKVGYLIITIFLALGLTALIIGVLFSWFNKNIRAFILKEECRIVVGKSHPAIVLEYLEYYRKDYFYDNQLNEKNNNNLLKNNLYSCLKFDYKKTKKIFGYFISFDKSPYKEIEISYLENINIESSLGTGKPLRPNKI